MDDMELMKNYYEVTRIPIQIIQSGHVIRQFPDKAFEPSPALIDFERLLISQFPACYTTTLGTMLTGMVHWKSADLSILFGPAPLYPCSSSSCMRILQTMDQPEDRLNELLHWIHMIPVYDSVRFQKMLHFLDFAINGVSEMRIQYIDDPSENPAPRPEADISTTHHFTEHVDVIQETILEHQMLSLVESGNILELQKSIHTLYHWSAQPDIHTLNADRYLRNIFIGSNSMVCRAAIRGGLSASVALDLSDRFIAQIESCKNYDEILMFLSQMFITYTKAVAEAKLPESDSPIVRRIMRNIRDHIYEPLSPTDIALNLHMDLSYLCHHFKEQTGQTISSCINEIKITESKRLIRTTDLSLAQIAMQMGYSSQNYFHRVFKKVTGMTPKAYAKTLS